MKTVFFKGEKLKVVEVLGIREINNLEFKVVKAIKRGNEIHLKIDPFNGAAFETNINQGN